VAPPVREEAAVESFYLRDVEAVVLDVPFEQQADAGLRAGGERIHRFAEYPASPGRGLQVSGEDVDDGGLTGAVLSEQSDDVALLHIETEILVYKPFAVIVRYVFASDDRIHVVVVDLFLMDDV